jgi:hypothetical protein
LTPAAVGFFAAEARLAAGRFVVGSATASVDSPAAAAVRGGFVEGVDEREGEEDDVDRAAPDVFFFPVVFGPLAGGEVAGRIEPVRGESAAPSDVAPSRGESAAACSEGTDAAVPSSSFRVGSEVTAQTYQARRRPAEGCEISCPAT